MHEIKRSGKEDLFCMLFFDEQYKLKAYGQPLINIFAASVTGIDFYYSLYPSKRSRGPFQPMNETYLCSMFQGQHLLFERELVYTDPISQEIINIINQFKKKKEKTSQIADKNTSFGELDQDIFDVPSILFIFL